MIRNPLILLIVDEEESSGWLAPLLERNGFNVLTVYNGKDVLGLTEKSKPDLIVMDGFQSEKNRRVSLRNLQKHHSRVPIILLSQMVESFERANALDEGADDYLTKPFDPIELIARMRAVLRRTIPDTPSLVSSWKLKADSLLIDRKKHEVFLDAKKIHLTPKAYALLDFLMTHPDEVLSRERLLSAVWDWNFDSDTRALSNRIAELRYALNEDIENPMYIETVCGRGYRFLKRVESLA